jgi:glycosyltransferase involved in cell wall biosynthesis
VNSPRRRVVHCIRSDSFAGVERYVANVAPELARRGWDVHVIGGDPARMRAELGLVRHTPADTTRAVVSGLYRHARGAIVHTHMTAAELAATSVHLLRGFPFVTTRHFASPRGSSAIARLGAPLIARAVDRQISISRFVSERIREPSTVVLSGVPSVEMELAPESLVLVAQRLEPEKQTDIAIRAWAASSLRNEGWQLTVAGNGSRREELTGLAASLGVHDSVEFAGVQTDMASLMSRAAIFLGPAPTEPFGLSVVEAMAAGVPVVAARGGGHIETVGAASEHSLFSAGDWRAAAEMLDSLGADPGARRRRGLELQAWQREHLSIEAHVDQLERVYAELRQ